jgi:hypothetical protein
VLRAINTLANVGHYRHKWLWQQFMRICFPDNRRQVLPRESSNIISAETELLSNQVLHPFNSTRNSLWWIGVAMIAFYENTLGRNCGAKLRVSGDS